MNLDLNFRYLLGLGGIILFLVSREAVLLPLTHDEYATIMVSYQSVFDIISYKDPVPNNHILNTLLLKLNILTFGDNIFSNRFHNVLSFIPYYIFSVLVARALTSRFLHQIAFITFVTLQPFLLDFFSVSRGYGLSVTFQMASIYYAILFIQKKSIKFYTLSILLAAVGVIANFTLLNFYFPLLAILFYFSIKFFYSNNLQIFKKSILYSFLISTLLGLVCFLPLTKMVSTNQFVFWDSNNFFSDTIVPLFNSLKVGVSYFNWNGEVYALVFLGVLVLMLISIIVLGGKNILKNKTFQFSFSILLLVILYNNIQFYIAKVPFLNARTSLFFIPLVALFVFSILLIIKNYSQKSANVISIILIILCCQHFIRGYNGRANFEWYFNQNTYEVLDDLMYEININNLQKPVRLDCHWFHHPSLFYHIEQKYKGIIELLPYHKETPVDSQADFYFSEPDDTDIIKQKFSYIKQYKGGFGILWKKTQ